jgi:hypothetical protein
MTKMSSIRCFKGATTLALVAVLLVAMGTAAAISVSSEGVPSASAVEDSVTVTYTIEDPHRDAPSEWTLEGSTELTEVRWTVTVKQGDSQVSENIYDDQAFSEDLSGDGDRVVVELDGTTPAIENYTFDPEERYTVATLNQTTGENVEELVTDSAHHYTNKSKAARDQIDAAGAAIEAAGGNDEAEELQESAISAYEAENFENAERLATNAEEAATSAQQSQELTTMLLIGAGVVLALLVIGGGIYRWKAGQDKYSKL